MEASLCAAFVCSLYLHCLDHAGRRGARQADTGRGSHAVTLHSFSAKRNGQLIDRNCRSGRPANGTGICYNAIMAKQRKLVTKGAKVGGFVVGRAHFAKISAVERIELTPVMEKRASEASQKGLTADEYRRAIVRSHRKG
jgi:hypothetical protein